MSFEWLEQLKTAGIIIDKNLNVVYANKLSRNLNQGEGDKCYSFLFGFKKPCWEIPGYSCPLREIKENNLERSLTVNKYPVKGKFKKLILETFKIQQSEKESLNLYLELIFEFDPKKFQKKDKNPFRLSKFSMLELIQELLNKEKNFYLSVLNIKKLKAINQIFGIEVGDTVIEAIEKILNELSQKYKFYFAQIAGGYFVVLDITEQKEPYRIEKELFGYIQQLQTLFNLPLKPQISIVSAFISPLITQNADEVFKILFYAEKYKTDEGILYVDPQKLAEILKTLGLKQKLFKKLEEVLHHDAIDIYYQPIVELKTEKITHAETLIRIKQNGSVIPIGEYIELIYELGLIIEFDKRVLKKLRQHLATLKEICPKISVNISAPDLKNKEFQQIFFETLQIFRKEGINLVPEITEQTLLEDLELMDFVYRTYDIKFSIDDFGTGYSSLRLVIDLSQKGLIESIKLDCSLIRDYPESTQARAVVDSVAGFANQIGLTTVAECVENEKQVEALKKAGITHAQGFYFYKPLPINQLLEVCKKNNT